MLREKDQRAGCLLRAACGVLSLVMSSVSRAEFAVIDFTTRVRVEHLGGDGARSIDVARLPWNLGGAASARLEGTIEEPMPLTADAFVSMTPVSFDEDRSCVRFESAARAIRPSLLGAEEDLLADAADASAFGAIEARGVLAASGRVIVRGGGSFTGHAISAGRCEGSISLLAIDGFGTIIGQRIIEPGDGSWSVDFYAEAAAGAVTLRIEWRCDALGESQDRFAQAMLTGELRLTTLPGPFPQCQGDADGTGFVDFRDLAMVLRHMGAEYDGVAARGDANLDGRVDFADVPAVLRTYGSDCE